MVRFLLALGLIAGLTTMAQSESITPQDAPRHVGQMVTVCGEVFSAHFAARSRGQPTFLDMDGAYPNEALIALIWGDDCFGTLVLVAGGRTKCPEPVLPKPVTAVA